MKCPHCGKEIKNAISMEPSPKWVRDIQEYYDEIEAKEKEDR